MEFVTGVAANLASEAAKGIVDEGQQIVRYAKTCEPSIDKFNEKKKLLRAKRKSVQQKVDEAERSGKKIKADVRHWCKTVDKKIKEMKKKVKVLKVEAKKKNLLGLCPNLNSRYQCSLTAEEGARIFEGLIEQSQFNEVGYLDVPEAIVDESPNGFETFKSREKVFNDIMEAMKDATISMIGVHGMPGVGKTSLVHEVARQVQEVKLFDSVVTVTVAQAPDIQKIQENITELLGLRLEDKSKDVRARRLHERLKQEKTVLIVLDDIWKRLDLKEVGIPLGNQHKGCKILLTSRDRDVLLDGMKAEKTFVIDVLDDEEAWNWFRKMAGDGVERAELRSTAIEVAKKCARLPLAIATVANALSKKPSYVWKDALQQLRSRKLRGKYADAYLAIELSYNHLENEELKQVFLLCGLVRRDARFDDLLKYAIGLGFIEGVGTMEEARNRLLTMVSDLKASCLLLDNNTNYLPFDMHDLVYDVAMSIASKDKHAFALNKEDVLKDWPEEETMKKCKMIHVGFLGSRELPDELNCPHLIYFRVFGHYGTRNMPPKFFGETTSLKVLDVTDMRFSSLSLSLCLLKSLRTLCLDRCELGDISIIGELSNLEILNLSASDIRILPKEIGRLVKLKLLDLSFCHELTQISPGVLSSLLRLEELYMMNSPCLWKVEGSLCYQSNASLAELKNLSRLTALEVSVLNFAAMSGGFFEALQKLERYKIWVRSKNSMWFSNENYRRWFPSECSRTLALPLSSTYHDLGHGIKMLLKKTEALYLDGDPTDDNTVISIFNDNGAADKIEFAQLRYLSLSGRFSKYKSCSTSMPQRELPLFSEKVAFPSLEEIVISNLRSIKMIWQNQLPADSFPKLQRMRVEKCGDLLTIFPTNTLRAFQGLQTLRVEGCALLEEIFEVGRSNMEETCAVTLQLRELRVVNASSLKYIWKNYSQKNYKFENLKELHVSCCKDLENVFPASISRSDLPQLRDLQIVGCRGKDIVSSKQGLETAVTLAATTFGNYPPASSLDGLPRTLALTMHQGSTVTTMDFHPSHHTLLLVGSSIGEITLWELGMREKLVTKPFKVWEMSKCTTTFQALMVNDTLISVSRVTWSPDGGLVGIAFSKHLIHLYAYPGPNDLIQPLEIDAHVGGVNDLAFAYPNEQLCIVSCGDDKLVKVWDSMTGQKLFNFEGHDAPVYSICPHRIFFMQLIYSTAVDGKIKHWQFDNMGFIGDYDAPGSIVDYDAPGHCCATMLYSTDGWRRFSCGTSKDGESFLVEWNGKGEIKRTYEGFRNKSAGVVSFDTAQNHFLAVGEDSQIKFWDMDYRKLLTLTDAEGGLPSLPRVRFSKEGNLLAVTTADNGFKILANNVGLRSLKFVDDEIENTKP